MDTAKEVHCWEMRPGVYYMCKKHIYRTDGKRYFRRPFDVWSEKYVPVWQEQYYEELVHFRFTPIPAGTKFPLLPSV